jgi:hypothetical protein
MHWLYHSFIFTCWLLHVSAVTCHHQGAYWILLSYSKMQTEVWYISWAETHNTRNHDNPAHRPRNHTLCDVPCHHQGAYWILLSYLKIQTEGWYISWAGTHNTRNHDNPAHRPRNHTLYDIPTLSLHFQVTQEDPISSLMMAGYCRNM